MRNSFFTQQQREAQPVKKINEALSHGKIQQMIAEEKETAEAIKRNSREKEELPEFDFWFSWN